jgi:hypothetical protein
MSSMRVSRVEHVRSGILVGLQSRDRVGEFPPADDEVLCAAGKHQPSTRRVRRRGHAFGGMFDCIERLVLAPGRVLDRAAGQAGVDRAPHGLRDALGVVGEPVLEVRGHRQRGGRHDGGRVGERLLPRDRVVHPAERGGEAAAGGGERREAERGQQFRRPGVPRVRDQ